MATDKQEDNVQTNEATQQERALKQAERAIDAAYATGRADRATITRMAQLDAAEAVALAGVAMEADEEADEAAKLAVITEGMGDPKKTKAARAKERAARKRAKAEHRAATRSAKRAYDAIKFSAPNKLGFMRVVQVIFALHIAFIIVGLIQTSRDVVTYNHTNLLDWLMIILEGLAFWFFLNRYKIARPFVIVMASIGIAVPMIYDLITGVFSPFVVVANSLFYIFLILYFSLSRRVKAVLVNDISRHKGFYDDENFVINRKGWPFIRNLIMYFIIFSVLGHWMEAGMCQFIRLGLVEGEYDPTNTMLWRDWLYPFPMEGAAVVFIALFLYPFKQWLVRKIPNRILPYVISFVANALTCSIIEFTMGLLINADLQLWDYSENFGNIMGQVCLQNALAFGVAASLIAWFLYPMLERWIARIPNDIMNIAFVVVAIFGGILWSLYIIDPPQVETGVSQSSVPEEEMRLGQLKNNIDSLEENVNRLTGADKEEMEAHVKEMREYLQQRMDEEGIKELPSYEDLVAADVTEMFGGEGVSRSAA